MKSDGPARTARDIARELEKRPHEEVFFQARSAKPNGGYRVTLYRVIEVVFTPRVRLIGERVEEHDV